jgi:cysteine desulfurase family protein (TIGR01976 family)
LSDILDVDFCRSQFPLLAQTEADAYFESAGGSYVPQQVIDAMSHFMRDSQTQPEWPFAAAKRGKAQIDKAQKGIAALFNISPDELVIGPSTTLNAYVLSHALRPGMADGDAIVVTNQDHEANGGCWRRLADTGIDVREWRIDPKTGDLDPADLTPLLADGKVKLVAFPHVSNIVGSINDVAAITRQAHQAGAMVVVDGVAAVAHTLPDLVALDVDFYMFSFYKLYGPHLAMLYGKKARIDAVANQNHFFHDGNGAAMLNPGGTNYESAGAIGGILDYLDTVHDHHFDTPSNDPRSRAVQVYTLFQQQEATVMARFLAWLETRPEIRLIGRRESDPARRAATFSLDIPGHSPEALAIALAERGLCVGAGHFYGRRCVEALGIDPEIGVLRVSMVHYSTVPEVDRLTNALDALLS